VYTIDGDVVTQAISGGVVDRTITYTFDGRGNVVSQRWTDADRDDLLTFADFDDAPNPYLLTNGLLEEFPLSANRYARHITSGGCEFVSTLTHEAGLLVADDSVGCDGPDGTPTEHHFRFEYVPR